MIVNYLNKKVEKEYNYNYSIYNKDYTDKRKLPENFNEADLKYFSHELEKHIPATKIFNLKNVAINHKGIIFKYSKLIDLSFADNFKEYYYPCDLLKQYTLGKKRRLKGENFIWISHQWGGVYHWLAEHLPRLYVATSLYKDIVLILPDFLNTKYFIETLQYFDLKDIIFIKQDEIVKVDKLIIPYVTAPGGNYNKEIFNQYRNYLKEKIIKNKNDKYNNIYVSRALAERRKIDNENELTEYLSTKNIKAELLENYSFRGQVELMANNKFLIGQLGAGMTNMMFMPRNSTVYLFIKKNDTHNNCYFSMANAMDFKFYYQICEAVNPDEDPYSANLIVDIEQLKNNIKLIF